MEKRKKRTNLSPNKRPLPQFAPRREPIKPVQREAIDKLMDRYNMDEATATDVANGKLNLDSWLAKREEEDRRREVEEQFLEKVNQFSYETPLSLPITARIMRNVFHLEELLKRKQDRLECEEKAIALVAQHGIPMTMARWIAQGRISIEEYVRREKARELRKAKAQAIFQEHPEIALETCYQIVDHGVPLEEYLRRANENKHKRSNWYRNYIREHKRENRPLNAYLEKLLKQNALIIFFLVGQRKIEGCITGFTPYEITVNTPKGESFVIPKLQIKYFLRSTYQDGLKYVIFDEERQARPVLPDSDPKNRYCFPESIPAKGQCLRLALGDGEILIGKVRWFSKFDIKVSLSEDPKVSALIFRHAVIDVRLVTGH